MNIIKFFCFVLSFYFLRLSAEPIAQEESKIVNLREPANTAKMQFVKEILTNGYAAIGYKINWLDIAVTQELILAINGKLAAAITRNPIIEQQYPKLVKVPFKLFNFNLLKVSDRLRCGYCLNEDIHSIIYAKGMLISAQYAQALPLSVDKLAIQSSEQLNGMILKRRVDSMFVMDYQLDPEIAENHHMIVENIYSDFAYHYLSPNFKHLKEPLDAAFKQLQFDGTIEKLKQKYNFEIEKKLEVIPQHISFISGEWLNYTNDDGTGIYWNILGKVFENDFSLTKNTDIWDGAVRAFEQNKVDVLVGAYRNEKVSNALYSSFHIDYEYPLYAFAHKAHLLSRFKDQDKTLTACVNVGSSLIKYVEFLPQENIIETSLLQCNLLIKKGEVDLVVEYDYNLDQETIALPKVLLRENSPLFLVFHNTAKGHYLKKYFDKNIVKLARTNMLKQLFPNEITYKQAHIRP